jgi:hypothetical protein
VLRTREAKSGLPYFFGIDSHLRPACRKPGFRLRWQVVGRNDTLLSFCYKNKVPVLAYLIENIGTEVGLRLAPKNRCKGESPVIVVILAVAVLGLFVITVMSSFFEDRRTRS